MTSFYEAETSTGSFVLLMLSDDCRRRWLFGKRRVCGSSSGDPIQLSRVPFTIVGWPSTLTRTWTLDINRLLVA